MHQGKVSLEQLAPASVAAHFGCSLSVAAQALTLCHEQAAAAVEALGLNTAVLRDSTATHQAKPGWGGRPHEWHTSEAMQQKTLAPQALLQQAGAAYARSDSATEAHCLAQYWNSYAGHQALDSQLMPSAQALASTPVGTKQRALLDQMSRSPPHLRLQLLRDFVAPKTPPQPAPAQPSIVSSLMSGLQNSLHQVSANPAMALSLVNPMLGFMIGMQNQPAVSTELQPAVPSAPPTLAQHLTQVANNSYHQHLSMHRHYLPAAQLMPLISRFAAAAESLDARLRERLQPAFEQALARGDGDAVFALTTRAEAFAEAAYEAKLKAALAEP